MIEPAADPAYEAHLRETVDGAASLLSSAFGRRVDLEIQKNFREPDDRATVLRCRVVDGRDEMPATAIVKRFRLEDGSAYDPDDATSRARVRLLAEWTGVRFLHGLGGERPFSPAPYAGDGRLGIVVLEDLGDGTSLADLLTGDDAIGAESGLFAYASTLGRLQAATVGGGARYTPLMERSLPASILPRPGGRRLPLGFVRRSPSSTSLFPPPPVVNSSAWAPSSATLVRSARIVRATPARTTIATSPEMAMPPATCAFSIWSSAVSVTRCSKLHICGCRFPPAGAATVYRATWFPGWGPPIVPSW